MVAEARKGNVCESAQSARGASSGRFRMRAFRCGGSGFSALHSPMWNNLPVDLHAASSHDLFLVACAAGTVRPVLILIAKVRLHPALALPVDLHAASSHDLFLVACAAGTV